MPSYGGTTSYAYDTKNALKTGQSTADSGYISSYNFKGQNDISPL